MARFAIIDAGRVINHAEADEAFAQSQGWIPADESRIGDSWDGEVFTPAPPEPIPVPASCSRRQGLLALLAYGHRRADIEALIAAIPEEMEREAALIEYEAATWERANPFLQQMWAQLGGTPEQLDDLFRMAVTL